MLWFRAPEKVYFKKGSMPVALDELGTVLNKKKAFIITDSFLYKNGNIKPVEEKLDTAKIQHIAFFNAQPTLAAVREGAAQIRLFEPDVIIALGGGSVIDAAKAIWVLYEHPEADFEDLAKRFSDIRKREEQFPKLGAKAYFVAIPTSSGTGSEVTPYSVITDEEKQVQYTVADYELLPNMAIVDADYSMNQPKELTGKSGIVALAHAILAYAGQQATEYTDGFALNAAKDIFDYLPSAYENGADDPKDRKKMANASAMAGIAFANVAYEEVNASDITNIIKANAESDKNAFERYVECAKFLGFIGSDKNDTFDRLIAAIEELQNQCGIVKD